VKKTDRAAGTNDLSAEDWLRILGPARKSWLDNFLIPIVLEDILASRRGSKPDSGRGPVLVSPPHREEGEA